MINIQDDVYATNSRLFLSLYAVNEYLRLTNNNDIVKVKIGMRNATLSYKSTFAFAQKT